MNFDVRFGCVEGPGRSTRRHLKLCNSVYVDIIVFDCKYEMYTTCDTIHVVHGVEYVRRFVVVPYRESKWDNQMSPNLSSTPTNSSVSIPTAGSLPESVNLTSRVTSIYRLNM